ncbi:4-hydroxy-tetrahydrodipicolinate synthase [Lacticaseibacillus baoqingensis]|uniref:4-hydroxy-tetrahydrodipicolinate synthase n=1 Tax=Lacticaseibacillus baoqingensis TaxID=2486013 RepID=A0ABW4E8F4_9LACO|nr:4-hydroxy-tetrahydrodipicolinate synthase [Lacticaseibacillus baoqingensis]
MLDAELITAIITPFDANDEIDYAVLANLTEHLLQAGSDGFVIGGTTGEGPTLSQEEKLTLFTRFADIVHGRAVVIANVGSNNTRQSAALAEQVSAIAGVDGLLVVVPYYNKPDQSGMIAHFTAVANAATKPVVIYNIPGRTGVDMQVATVATLAKHQNIVGIKQCGDLNTFAAIVDQTPADFHVWTGEDAQFIQVQTLGGAGVISVASHLYADEMAHALAALRVGDLATTARLQRALLPKMAALFAWPSPAPTKAALNATGFAVGAPRLPLLPLTDEQQQTLMYRLQLKTGAAL